jgi:hypothetical protein
MMDDFPDDLDPFDEMPPAPVQPKQAQVFASIEHLARTIGTKPGRLRAAIENKLLEADAHLIVADGQSVPLFEAKSLRRVRAILKKGDNDE